MLVSTEEVPSPEEAEELLGGNKEEVDGPFDDTVSGCYLYCVLKAIGTLFACLVQQSVATR